MVFNSVVFFFFFIVVLFLYHQFFSKKINTRNIFLILASLYFYGWWDWRFVCLWLFTALTDYFIAKQIRAKPEKAKSFLTISILVNLGVLGFFKYYNFFISSFCKVLEAFDLHASESTLQIILPVGISFYTFQALSYTIDVYRKKIEPEYNLPIYLAFISFFPQLVAGPIERAQHMLPQFRVLHPINYNIVKSGLAYILWGLFKKVVIADNLAIFVDEVFDHNQNYSGSTNIIAALFFTLQIYCDFSGYSDIAVGTARLLGFELSQNFNHPYHASSFRDFWIRWHISLSSWFRDYVYIPLGGNKKSKLRTYFNLNLTFILSGLWHGANFTFIIWGALHGLFISIEKFMKGKLNLPAITKRIIVFCGVCFAWIFFRAHSVHQGALFIRNIFRATTYSSPILDLKNIYSTCAYGLWFFLPLLFFIMSEMVMCIAQKGPENLISGNKFSKISFYYLLIAGILLFGVFNNAPSFIYFQF
ncbi:MAG: MBOAT family O-acyltransferase [Bacteroidia bacterium]